jgi:hypothetical protein
MNNNQKIFLGLSAVALGYYFYIKSKKNIATQNPCKNENEVPCNNGSGKCYMINARYMQDPCKIDDPKTNISPQEKENLFLSSIRPKRGIQISPEQKNREDIYLNEIQNKIDTLGLRQEYEIWLSNYNQAQSTFALPQ